MTKDSLLNRLSIVFKNTDIVTLRYIVEKIAIISKVRVGKKENRTFTKYDEISLNDIDSNFTIYVPFKAKKSEAASEGAISKQALKYGDLVLNQRTAKMKVGFVGNNYKRVIVGNNSMIRIQFYNTDKKIEISRFVQLYLQQPYVLEYLNNLPTCSKSDRRILSSAQLLELPIPDIKKGEMLSSFMNALNPRVKLLQYAKEMQEVSQKLINRYETKRLNTINVDFRENFDKDEIIHDMQDKEIFEEFMRLYKKLL